MKRVLVGSVVVAVLATGLALSVYAASPAEKAATLQKAENTAVMAKSARELPTAAHLMDRNTKADRAQNILQPGAITPNASPAASGVWFGYSPTHTGWMIGNVFNNTYGVPTGWYPFRITGAFAYQGNAASGTGPTHAGLGAGAVVGSGSQTWVSWDYATTSTIISGAVGGTGLYGTASAGGVSVLAGSNAVCGLNIYQDWGNLAIYAGASDPACNQMAIFGGNPPYGSSALANNTTFACPTPILAGCYVAGATVPVELQAFTAE